jgi:hypothetical protein
VIENLYMAGTIHGLDGIFTILRGGREHGVLEFIPMPRALPETAIDNLRSVHFLVTIAAQQVANVVLN